MKGSILSLILVIALSQESLAGILNQAVKDRKLVVKSVTPSSQEPDRGLAIFSSDDKTREIIKLRKEIASAEGLIKQYEGGLIRRSSHNDQP